MRGWRLQRSSVAGAEVVAASRKATLLISATVIALAKRSIHRGFTFEAATLVDVSITDLPLSEAAGFLSAFQRGRILVPADTMNERISLDLKRRPFGDVLNELGLNTHESVDGGKRKIGLLTFLAGLGIGALISSLALGKRSESRR